jgi:alpha-tubulin suppressor-like RCC1 family protein
MPSGVNFSSVSTGNNFSCGVGFSGVIYCWGANATGQLGDGTTAPHLLPAPVAAPAGLTFTQVFATANGTGGVACGLATTGIPYCWGDNPQGVLGDGTTTGHNTPQPVTMPAGVTFVDISGSNTHVCGVTARGAVYCWGANSIGELGDNTSTPHLTPVRVAR